MDFLAWFFQYKNVQRTYDVLNGISFSNMPHKRYMVVNGVYSDDISPQIVMFIVLTKKLKCGLGRQI